MQASGTFPLVSCIMPTYNRRRFMPQAIRYFLRQDYPNKELVILDDGTESAADLVPDNSQIHYIRLTGQRTLGAKRNQCVEASQGQLIMHWDDDDWMASHRISYQVEALVRAGAEVCGLRQMLFYELATGQPWLYNYPAHQRPWLAGGSLLYTPDFWRRSPFPDIQVGEDTRFVWSHKLEHAAVPPDHRFYVAMIHPANTSPKKRRGAYWSRWEGDLRQIVGDDLYFYTDPQLARSPRVVEAQPAAISASAGARRAVKQGQHHQPLGGTLMKLNLGCFDRLLEGFVNVDWLPGPGVEVVDLRQLWPWPDATVDHIRAHDVIEHLPDKILTMNELWRVLKPGGTVEIMVPTTDGSGAFQDPTHVSFWNRHSFLYYETGSPYRERFAQHYGITAKFRTRQEQTERTSDGPRLTITLEAIKP